MLRKNIALDLGNGLTKIRKADGNFYCFRSSTSVGTSRFDDNLNHSITVIEDGVKVDYTIGEVDGSYYKSDRRYYLDEYRAIALTGIALSVAGAEEGETDLEINLGINLPIELYKDKSIQGAVINNLKGKHEYIFRGVKYIANVINVYPLPENLIISSMPAEVTKHKNLFVDIGDGTVDLLFTEGKKLGRMGTEYEGIKNLMSDVARKSEVDERQIIRYWKDLSEVTSNKKQLDIMGIQKKAIEQYVNKIIGMAEEVNQGNLNDTDCIFLLGGGADIVADTFKRMLRNTKVEVIRNPKYINLINMEKMLNARIK